MCGRGQSRRVARGGREQRAQMPAQNGGGAVRDESRERAAHQSNSEKITSG